MKSPKIITIQEAINLVENNDNIVLGMAGAEPKEFIKELHKRAGEVNNVRVTNCLPFENGEFFVNPEYKSSFSVDSWFYGASLRKAHDNGNISFIPNHLHLAGRKRFEHTKPRIYVGTATPPDKHGFLSLSLSNVYEKEACALADIVILEVSPHFPRTFGDLEIHESKVDYIVNVDYYPPVLPDAEPNEKDIAIGNFIADKIKNGSTLQLGIGGIPNAVAHALLHKKDLGIHTEMFTTGLMKLVKAGAANGSRKKTHPGKHVCCFALGTQELYDFIDNNPSVQILNGHYVNDPAIIGLNDNQVSINTTIEVDLTGQCASESIGHRQFSGTGGQSDTAVGAQNSKGGMSFITLYSTAMVKNPKTGEREEISKIVPFLKPGAIVTLSRADVDYVVTEYGCVSLRGTSVAERVELLISIAHPKFRESLRAEAISLGYIS
ncbi:MAG: acetyl-CoA hydrolase [Tenericutes bacterium GWC2_34_14]|nr:MAG: acetyl-CoA hydrolase [Tenericutes bacterium GWA2_35_7]OHE29508.1 MAG: acetyl-CoA hydrolase [Tenericutes bacterium GWC2_34_14]OHE34604.1 MAG: acetyl-CoA hydrolase [Tenericutes bacterium GWE2_34_108]OHE35961.1 MAG: acetyl-CoA hydrolase [Tenericutes bacterium GWF1_35_14]OHE38953.1 MAG: acetyl-CoA hydrolase [Tenericutes bacterium GWF2_35_184]OHE42194.1 MAG: acetyl-CoA hydrolase [Tenericutes bacterium RIFOXYA12_FULL_35_10]OHE42980.1 MAG: acetyl-CoA hydrolase [Tenericutes bacterium RIFOXYA2